MSSNVAARALVRSRNCLPHVRRHAKLPLQSRVVLSTSTNSQQSDSSKDVVAAALASAVVAAGALFTIADTKDQSACDTKTAFPLHSITAETEPRRFMTARQQPRNVMLHRMRSGEGRGLNDKYNVDWNTNLGEGAYGSVHPARLAATGEKVRRNDGSPSSAMPSPRRTVAGRGAPLECP
jgi:hypothetical protein